MSGRRFSTIVIMYTPQMYVAFTRNPDKARKKGPGAPVWWRIIGGRERDELSVKETPEQTATREAKEESGKILEKDDLFLVAIINKGDHDLHVFSSPVDTLDDIRPEPSKIGVEVKSISLDYVASHQSEFHRDHIGYLVRAGLIKKSSVEKTQISPAPQKALACVG